jgi:polyhydroxyalkanoate synthesis regulator protein
LLVLLQIIATREERVEPALSAEFLLQAIRSYEHVPHDLLATFLEQDSDAGATWREIHRILRENTRA